MTTSSPVSTPLLRHRGPWLLAGLALLSSCGSTTRRVQPPDTRAVRPPVVAARQSYEDARGLWREAMGSADASVAEAAVVESLRKLRLAREANPGNPLLRSKAGDLCLLLALGTEREPDLFHSKGIEDRERFDQARAHYEDSLAVSADWIPGHLGLARVALLANTPEAAEEHLVAAEGSLRRARGLAERDATFAELVFGVDLGPIENVDPMGSLRPEQQRVASYNGYLAAEVGGWVIGSMPGADSSVAARGTFDRLSARIVLLRGSAAAQAVLAEGLPRDEALLEFQRGVEEALRYDGDYFQATLARARALAEQGLFGLAADLLEPYLQGSFGLIKEQDWILALEARWSIQAFSEDRDYDRMLRSLGWIGARVEQAGGSQRLLPLPLLELVMLRSDLFLTAGRGKLRDGAYKDAELSLDLARKAARDVEYQLGLLGKAGFPEDQLELLQEAHKQHEQEISSVLLDLRRTSPS